MDSHLEPLPNLASRTGNSIATFFEKFIYGGRWVIAPMYVGLLLTLVIYTYKFLAQFWELCHRIVSITEAELLISVLGMVDNVMIGNLLILIMIGSYYIFVRKMKMGDKPQWLDHIDSSTLKIKMGMSLIGVSSIHLLKDFIEAGHLGWDVIGKQMAIHGIFIVSTIALAFTGKLTHSSDSHLS